MQFKIIFHRYFNGRSRLSSATFVHAQDFDGALTQANNMLLGMRSNDLETRYIIASIDTVGLRGDTADGPTIWETSDEFMARMESQSA